ncbi:Methanogenesis regulatory histidine kinase FilI [uncultured archaeon]|nr:Methanogenesis regulatory histidine kinase FilI [uncultured archaeon]
MSIREKTLLSIVITILFLFLLIYGTSETLLLGSFANLEENLVLQNVNRAKLALSSDIDQINSTLGDWAPWNATYTFINDRNQKYIDQNLNIESLANLRLNLILFLDPSGKLVFAKAVDLQAGKELPIPPNLLSNLFSKGSLICHNESDMFKGIVLLPEGPLLISSQPILTSTWQGPVRGTLIMGRYFDSELEHLSELTQLPLFSRRIDDANLPTDFAAAQSHLSIEKPVLIKSLSQDSIAGYALIKDVYGDPSLIIRVNMPRDIYQQGRSTIYRFYLFILFIGLSITALSLLLLDKNVLSRIGRLGLNVRNIGLCGDISPRVQVDGDDEISSLAAMINEMLDRIDRAEGELRISARLAAIGEMALMVGHDLSNPLQAIMTSVYLAKEKLNKYSLQNQKDPMMQDILFALSSIEKQSNYMSEILSDLHDFTRPLNPKIVDIDILSFVKKVIAMMKIPKNIEVQTEIEGGLTWKGDPTMMERVLVNLINNAIQAMPDAGKLIVAVTGSEEGTVLKIKDTGTGIPPELISKVFTPLFTTKSRGIGMGLVIVKRLVEAQGGSINMESVMGKGTVAIIRMPNRKT